MRLVRPTLYIFTLCLAASLISCARKSASRARLQDPVTPTQATSATTGPTLDAEEAMPKPDMEALSNIQMQVEEKALKETSVTLVTINLDPSADFARVIACPAGSQTGCHTYESTKGFVLLFGLESGSFDLRGSKCFRNRVRLDEVTCGKEATQTITYKKISNPELETQLSTLAKSDLEMRTLAQEVVQKAATAAAELEAKGADPLSPEVRRLRSTQAIGADLLADAYKSGSLQTLKALLEPGSSPPPPPSSGGEDAELRKKLEALSKDFAAMKAKQKKTQVQQANGNLIFAYGEVIFVVGLGALLVGTGAKQGVGYIQENVVKPYDEFLNGADEFSAKSLDRVKALFVNLLTEGKLSTIGDQVAKEILETLWVGKLAPAKQKQYYDAYKKFYFSQAKWLENKINAPNLTEEELRALISKFQDTLRAGREYEYLGAKAIYDGQLAEHKAYIPTGPRPVHPGSPPQPPDLINISVVLVSNDPQIPARTNTLDLPFRELISGEILYRLNSTGNIGLRMSSDAINLKATDNFRDATAPTATTVEDLPKVPTDLGFEIIPPPNGSVSRQWLIREGQADPVPLLSRMEKENRTFRNSFPSWIANPLDSKIESLLDGAFHSGGKKLDSLLIDFVAQAATPNPNGPVDQAALKKFHEFSDALEASVRAKHGDTGWKPEAPPATLARDATLKRFQEQLKAYSDVTYGEPIKQKLDHTARLGTIAQFVGGVFMGIGASGMILGYRQSAGLSLVDDQRLGELEAAVLRLQAKIARDQEKLLSLVGEL